MMPEPAPPGPPPPNPPYVMFLVLVILLLLFPLIIALVLWMMRSEDERRESMKRWKILVLTPYIIMLATLLFYALLFGAVELLGLVIDGGVAQTNVWFKQIIMFAFLIFQAAVGIEIPFILIYTIILAIALFVRWIIAIAHLRKKE